MKKVRFDIQGMTCSSCSAHVENAVKKLKGMKKVTVNLLSNSMEVQYDEKILNDETIQKAVIDAGYGATIHNNKTNERNFRKNDDATNNINSMKKRLILSIIFLIPLMYISMNHMLYEWLGIPVPKIIKELFHGTENALIFAFTQLLLLLPILYLNRNYFIIGFKRLFKFLPNMDSLIALGSSASTVYGLFAIYMIGYGLGHGDISLVERYSMDIYFESAGTILTLITFGKYLETKSKAKTSDAITKLINLVPKTATIIRDNKEIEISVDEIKKDDVVIIKPGASIPVDGVIVEGISALDQSSITGESIPVQKSVGDEVISGTLNKNGYLKLKATKVGEYTTLSQIIKLVEEASNSKAPISKLADRVSGVFVPIVIIIAIISTLFWFLSGQSFEFALSIGIAVLVISCPCALGLATPVAIMVGTGKAAENGILVKSAESLELLHKVDVVVLDKTGTITEGKPKVIDVVSYSDISEKELLKIASGLEKASEHPLADAIVEKAIEEKINFIEFSNFTSVAGRGVKGKIKDDNYFGGNIAFMIENEIDVSKIKGKNELFEKNGKTVLYFAKNNYLLGIITVADTIKKSSKEAIDALKNKKIEVVMLTGDNKLVAETIGKELKIENVIAEVMPVEKEKVVSNLQKQGKKVAFVGDGINDSPALVRADVGIAIGSGTDIAIESADVVLIKNTLEDVVTAISLSKAVINNIKMNLFWAFFYNTIGIPVAAGVFYTSLNLKLNPMIGAAAMSLSSVCVVMNALMLRYFKSDFNKKGSKVKFNNLSYGVKLKENLEVENIKNKVCKKINGNAKLENQKEKEIVIMEKVIKIDGMQCNHCKMTVEKVLGALEGVTKVEVNLENKTATINSDKKISNEKIVEVISEAGFEVKEINN